MRLKGHQRRAWRWRLAGLLVALVSLKPVALHAASLNGAPTFRVREVSGATLTRRPNGVKWREVKAGMWLSEGDLVQVPTGASLRLAFKDDAHNDLGGIKAAQAYIDIQQPMVVRLEQNLLRKVQLETFFLNGLPSLAANVKDDQSVSLRMSLAEAWHRVSASFSAKPQVKTKEQVAEGGVKAPGMSLSVTAKSIDILSPINNGVIVGYRLPVEVNVAWRDVSGYQRPEYFLYAWEVDKARSEPVGITNQSFYSHLFMHYGSYQMQVATSDGHWQSQVMLVHIVPPTFDSAQAKKTPARKDLTAAAEDSYLVRLSYPPRNATLVQSGREALVGFYWQNDKDLRADRFRFSLRNGDNKVLHSVVTTARSLQLNLPRGSYFWHVDAVTAEAPPRVVGTSNERSVSIIASGHGLDTRAFVRNLLISGAHGTVELSTGL